MDSFTSDQIERFKRVAKQLRRTTALSHSQALDQIAAENGYSNWSLLMKHSDTQGATELKNAPPFYFTRTPEQMRMALHKVPEPCDWDGLARSDIAEQHVIDLSRAFVSVQNAITVAIDYMTCLLKVPRFKIYSAAPAYWEMRAWLPYECHTLTHDMVILVNRNYRPVGQVSTEWSKYEDFSHLHFHLTESLMQSFSARTASLGYLFNDGCPPWANRAAAVSYLERLKRLQAVLNR